MISIIHKSIKTVAVLLFLIASLCAGSLNAQQFNRPGEEAVVFSFRGEYVVNIDTTFFEKTRFGRGGEAPGNDGYIFFLFQGNQSDSLRGSYFLAPSKQIGEMYLQAPDTLKAKAQILFEVIEAQLDNNWIAVSPISFKGLYGPELKLNKFLKSYRKKGVGKIKKRGRKPREVYFR